MEGFIQNTNINLLWDKVVCIPVLPRAHSSAKDGFDHHPPCAGFVGLITSLANVLGHSPGFMRGRRAFCQLGYILRLLCYFKDLFYLLCVWVFCVYIGQVTSFHFLLASAWTHAFAYSHMHNLMPTPPSTDCLTYLLVVVSGFSECIVSHGVSRPVFPACSSVVWGIGSCAVL